MSRLVSLILVSSSLVTGCASKQTSAIATFAGGVLVGVGAYEAATTHSHCSDGCISFPPGTGPIVLGAPALLIGGISLLYHLATDEDPPPSL